MKSSMRAFGIGIFLAGASVALYNQFAPTDEIKDQKAFEQQIEQYEAKIAELEKQLHASEAAEDKTTNASTDITDTEQTTDDKEAKNDVVSATVYIYENMSLYSIGQQVEEEGIISNGRELELYLSKPEFARSIQKGAFDLSSDMNIEQIAKILTGKNNK
jgi:hypothetical protein